MPENKLIPPTIFRAVSSIATPNIDLADNVRLPHNVDITSIDTWIKEHEFPYRWYYATVAGKYRDVDSERGEKVITRHKEIDYGFARSREAGNESWQESLKLKKGNSVVKLRKPKNQSWFKQKL